MALVSCPECGKEVSSTAVSCPNCGFAVKDYFDKKEKDAADLAEFKRTHRELRLDDESWFILFSVYDYIIRRMAESSKKLLNYDKVWFDQGVPSYPIGFNNEWFYTIGRCYRDITKVMAKEMSSFPNPDIRSNIEQLQNYNYEATMRSVLQRWSDFTLSPFLNNSPVILQKAEREYSSDVARDSSMEFGIVTNSIAAMALYAVQSSVVEAVATNKANIKKQNYIDSEMKHLQKTVARAWGEHFKEFLSDVEILHQLVIRDLGEIVFKGYLFTWSAVGAEFSNKEKKRAYINERVRREERTERERQGKLAALDTIRNSYIEKAIRILGKAKRRRDSYQTEFDSIGFSVFGGKAEKRQQLKARIEEQNAIIAHIEPIVVASQRKESVINQFYTYNISCGWERYSQLKKGDECQIVYDAAQKRYLLFTDTGIQVGQLPTAFIKQYGVYRIFRAKYSSCTIHFQNNIEHDADIFMSITSVD